MTASVGGGASFRLLLGARARRVRWWVRALMGEDAYDKYVLHHEMYAPDAAHPLMTEREFWRDQTDRQDQNPQGRCC